jgi:hypothetical protein
MLEMTFLSPLTSLAANLSTFRDEGGLLHYTNVLGLSRSKFRLSVTKLWTKEKSNIPGGVGYGSAQ